MYRVRTKVGVMDLGNVMYKWKSLEFFGFLK